MKLLPSTDNFSSIPLPERLRMAAVGVGASGGINNMAGGFSKICRTCASCTDCLMPIFSGEGLLNNLPDKIHRHLPIKVSEWDRLPQQLCRQCASTLLAWHELVKCCTQADAALRTRLQRIQEHSAEEKVATTSGTSIPSEKVPTEQKSTIAPTPKNPVSRPSPDAQHKCTYCRANFTQRHLYHDHLASVHIDKLFHCDECGQYEDRRNLIIHMSKHAAEYTSGEKTPQYVKAKSTVKTTQKADLKEETIGKVSSSTGNGLQGKSTRLNSDTREPTQVDSGLNKLNGAKTVNQADLSKDVNTPKEVEEAKTLDDKMTLSELKKLKDMKALSKSDKNPEASSDTARGSGTARADSRLAFSDSDSSNGFGELPDSVFKAIEDTRDADESGKGAAKKSNSKGKKRKRVCNICKKEFMVSSSYFYHIKYVHGDNREHKCETCGHRFASVRTLTDHMSVHTGDRKHACPHCSKLFRSKAGLYIHVKDIHSGAQEKKFVCSQCDKSFRWKQKLILHYRRHKKDKSHVCSECSRGFSARCDLTRHMKTHSQNKPFECQKCGVYFAQRRYLQNHMAKKHSQTVSK